MSDKFSEDGDGDIRRRAAWLLGMLAVVAGLFVVLMVTFLKSSSPSAPKPVGIGGVDSSATPTATARPRHSSGSARRPATPLASRRPSVPGTRTCPTADACILQGDPGNAIKAINDYRKQNNLPAVPGRISKAAQTCALSNGSNCSGGWAESQVPDLTGAAALEKITKFGKLLDPQMTSLGVGWALDPASKQYFFAIVRQG